MSKMPISSAGRGGLGFSPESYIDSRAEQYADWYDKKAVAAKAAYLRSRVAIALGAIASPFFATQHWRVSTYGNEWDLATALGGVTGLAVAALVALEGVLKYQDQWKNYRTTEQYIRTQIVLFCNAVEEYDKSDQDKAFKDFVRNVEAAIKNENEVTLNVLTRDSGAEQTSKSKA